MLGLDFQKTKQHTKFSETSRTEFFVFQTLLTKNCSECRQKLGHMANQCRTPFKR